MPITDTTGLNSILDAEVLENEINLSVSFYVLKVQVIAGKKLVFKPLDNFSTGLLNNFEFTTIDDPTINSNYYEYLSLGEDVPMNPSETRNLNVNFCELLAGDLITNTIQDGNYFQDNSPSGAERKKPKTISYTKSNNNVSRVSFIDIIIEFLICIFLKLKRRSEKIIIKLYKLKPVNSKPKKV